MTSEITIPRSTVQSNSSINFQGPDPFENRQRISDLSSRLLAPPPYLNALRREFDPGNSLSPLPQSRKLNASFQTNGPLFFENDETPDDIFSYFAPSDLSRFDSFLNLDSDDLTELENEPQSRKRKEPSAEAQPLATSDRGLSHSTATPVEVLPSSIGTNPMAVSSSAHNRSAEKDIKTKKFKGRSLEIQIPSSLPPASSRIVPAANEVPGFPAEGPVYLSGQLNWNQIASSLPPTPPPFMGWTLSGEEFIPTRDSSSADLPDTEAELTNLSSSSSEPGPATIPSSSPLFDLQKHIEYAAKFCPNTAAYGRELIRILPNFPLKLKTFCTYVSKYRAEHGIEKPLANPIKSPPQENSITPSTRALSPPTETTAISGKKRVRTKKFEKHSLEMQKLIETAAKSPCTFESAEEVIKSNHLKIKPSTFIKYVSNFRVMKKL